MIADRSLTFKQFLKLPEKEFLSLATKMLKYKRYKLALQKMHQAIGHCQKIEAVSEFNAIADDVLREIWRKENGI